MSSKPVGPTSHGIIDYGFVTMQALAPTLFHLKGPAKTLCYSFAITQGILNALTDHQVGVKRVVSFRKHGELETPFVPALLMLPWITGALKQRNASLYFFSFFGIALANYLLTDYQANEKKHLKLLEH
jgi:hypothetical protein